MDLATTTPLREGERLDQVNDRLRLIQKADGMTFGTDALLLASFAAPCPKGKALELGAGTGIVSLMVATRRKYASVSAVEVQPSYADLCRRNVAINGLEEVIDVVETDLRELVRKRDENGDPIGPLPPLSGVDFDAVLTNPPYFAPHRGFASADGGRHIARHEVMGGIADFCRVASAKLKYGGALYLVYTPTRLKDLMVAMEAADLSPRRMTLVCDTADAPPSILLVEAKKGGRCELKMTRVLVLREPDGTPTPSMKSILEGGVFPF